MTLRERFWEMVSDGEQTSWTRLAGTFVIIIASVGLLYSIFAHFEAGVFSCSGLIGAVLGLKGYQSRQERLRDYSNNNDEENGSERGNDQ